MNEELLNAVEKLLENDKEIVIPVKKVWKILQFDEKFKSIEVPTLTEFIKQLKADDRFEFMAPVTYDNLYQGLNEKEREEREVKMEALGFFAGERIKLRKIVLTKELVADMIERSVNRIMNALRGAWENKPDDKVMEKKLLEVMNKTQKLQRDIKKLTEKMRKEKDKKNEK